MKLLRNPYGFAMMPMILVLFIVIGLISASVMMLGPAVQRGKTVEAKIGLEKSVDAIISWSVANGRLPTATELQTLTILPNPNDPWSRPLIYTYDSNLTSTATGGLCGRTTTTLFSGQQIAFIMLSGGEDYQVTSSPSTSGPFSGSPALQSNDLSRVVTLEELKNRAGCYGTTQGRLKIINNELPNACAGSATYPGTLFGDGGVPAYTWAKTSGPTWINTAPTTGILSAVGTITSTPGTYPLTITITDAHAPTATSVQKTFKLKVVSCGNAPINFNDIINDFTKVDGTGNNLTIDTVNKTINLGNNQYNNSNGYACLWYKTNQTLAGKTYRGFFNFKPPLDTSGSSTTGGDGFTFTFMQGANPTTVCGGAGEVLGYGNRDGHSIPGDSFAVEFDTYPNSAENDPGNYNHVTVVKNGSVKHNNGSLASLGPNPTCTGASHPSCYYINPISWIESGSTHKARIEVATGCNATCGTCGLGGSNSYALVKVWIDCSDSTCSQLTANYTAEAPSLTHCLPLPASMSDIKIGFTEATWGATQSTIISNFSAGFY